jgi:hypothetical protein
MGGCYVHIQATERAGVCHMRQDRSTPITETAEEPTGCGPDGYGGFAHHHRSVLDRCVRNDGQQRQSLPGG